MPAPIIIEVSIVVIVDNLIPKSPMSPNNATMDRPMGTEEYNPARGDLKMIATIIVTKTRLIPILHN